LNWQELQEQVLFGDSTWHCALLVGWRDSPTGS